MRTHTLATTFIAHMAGHKSFNPSLRPQNYILGNSSRTIQSDLKKNHDFSSSYRNIRRLYYLVAYSNSTTTYQYSKYLQTFGILLECQNVWIYVLQQDAHSHDSSTLYYTDFWNGFFQNVQIFMVMIPRTRSLVSLYIIYIHKRFICSSGLKYIKKSNSGKPQIICLKCFSLSKRNIETKYISQRSNSSQMSTFNF